MKITVMASEEQFITVEVDPNESVSNFPPNPRFSRFQISNNRDFVPLPFLPAGRKREGAVGGGGSLESCCCFSILEENI